MIFVIFVAFAKPRDRDFLMKFFDAFSTRCLAWRVWEAFALEKPAGNTWIDLSQTLHCPYLAICLGFTGVKCHSKGNPLLKVLNVPKIGKWLDMLIVIYLSGPRAILYTKIRGNVIQTWIYLVTNGVVNVMFRVMLEHLLNGMACSYTLWEGSRGQNVVVLFAFCKGLIRDNTVLRQNRTPKRYTSLYDNKRLYQLKSIIE